MTQSKNVSKMYQIAITSRTTSKEVRFSFPTTSEAKAYIKRQAKRKRMILQYGHAYNFTFEISPLF